MLASVTGPAEAEIALAGGADIIDLKDPSTGSLAALPPARITETLQVLGGRRATSAVAGDLPMQAGTVAAAVGRIAATGVDFVKVGLPPEDGREAVIAALAGTAAGTRLVGVLFADREPRPEALVPVLASAGFAGVMLDTADKQAGRLLVHSPVPRLAAFVRAARDHGLLVGLAGGLEPPDVPRLLQIDPDFLGFRGALCGDAGRRGAIALESVRAIRRLIPPEATASDAGNVDYRLLSARGWHPDTAPLDSPSQRIFVRDLVLPVMIGAYSHERQAPQNVRFDVAVDVRRPRTETQEMGEVFSYDLITDGIAAIVAEGHIDFVETLAERVARHVLHDPRARRVTVRVEKLDMGPGAVGVEITMDQPDRAAVQNPVLAMLDESARKPRQ